MTLIQFEMRKTRLQIQRVNEDVKIHSDSQNFSYDNVARFYADVHFLLICLGNQDSIFRKMIEYYPDEIELVRIAEKYGKSLREWNQFRNHLEHIEERASDGITGLGALSDDYFEFNGKRIGIGNELNTTIESFFKEVAASYEEILKRKKGSRRSRVVSGQMRVP